MPKKVIVNLFGGSGCGKSTCAAYMFSKIKMRNINVEMVFEYAKELLYLAGINPPFNQAFVFGNQLFKIEQYLQQSDILIVDSPLPLSIIYNSMPYLQEHFTETVLDAFNNFNNINYFLDNRFFYENQGRYQSEVLARESHKKIKTFLNNHGIPYQSVQAKDYDAMIEEVITYYQNNKEV